MSEAAPPKPLDVSQVKLIGIGHDQIVLSHVPGWYGEACGQGRIRRVGVKDATGTLQYFLAVETPTKVDLCKVGDIIKNSPLDALFVRHFSQEK